MSRRSVWLARFAIVVGLCAAWQWIPQLTTARDAFPFLDPFIISSPSRVATKIWDLFVGAHGNEMIWPYLGATLLATLVGTAVGTVVGCATGLLLGGSTAAYRILGPFVTAVNAMPRIAIIPVLVIILGPGLGSAAATAFFLVVFIVFFSAFEGARTIQPQILQNAHLLGASRARILSDVRLPYAVAWTFSVIPNALSFGLVGVVTAEILTGAKGVGSFLVVALNSVQSSLTFAIVLILSAIGILLVGGTELARRKLLHWWEVERV